MVKLPEESVREPIVERVNLTEAKAIPSSLWESITFPETIFVCAVAERIKTRENIIRKAVLSNFIGDKKSKITASIFDLEGQIKKALMNLEVCLPVIYFVVQSAFL
jgi:hypothetical protein